VKASSLTQPWLGAAAESRSIPMAQGSTTIIRRAALPHMPDAWDELSEHYWSLLVESECRTAQQLQGARRAEWILGRVAIKEAVACWLQERGINAVSASDIEVTVDAQGAPRVNLPTDIAPAVSLTHTRWVPMTGDGSEDPMAPAAGIVLAAVDSPGVGIGIDVESRHRSSPIWNRVFTAFEMSLIDDRFGAVGLLVAKESAAKAARTGLGGSLARWPVLARDDALIRIGDPEGRELTVQLHIDEAWIVGLCTTGEAMCWTEP